MNFTSDSKNVTQRPILRISPWDLDNLMTTLEVNFVKLSECLVSPGWRLSLAGSEAPGIHYNLGGTGRMIIGDQPPIDLQPHTLIIVPQGQPFLIEAPNGQQASAASFKTVHEQWQTSSPSTLRRFVAGDDAPQIILICGYFRALYGSSIDLFAALPTPIVERFDASDQLDHKLKSALAELVAQEVGMRAMTTALLKQVLVVLLRRSLSSINLWVERFSMLSDPQIARAFADMVARPSAPHSVYALSQNVGLSRSVFMARFAAAFDRSPMAVLRQIRMRHAATLLAANNLTIDQIAHGVGYASRSGFFRAFRKAYGTDPSEYRAAALRSARQRSHTGDSGDAGDQRKT